MQALDLARNSAQSIIRALGYEIRRYTLGEMEQLCHFLDLHGVDTVLDVGANVGQFAKGLRAKGYARRIVSFEPQANAHQALVQAAAGDKDWIVAPRAAVGAFIGEITMNISGNSVSSSALPIMEDHVRHAPGSAFIGEERVPVITLDTSDAVPASGALFVKIDTQGFEGEVVKGAQSILERAVGLQTEVSLAPLYDGQADYRELMSKFEAMGFSLWAIHPGIEDRETRRLLQMDATYFRSSQPLAGLAA